MHLKQFLVPSLLAFALAGAGDVWAADLNVRGQIQPVGACSLTLRNGGITDLGTLTFKQVAEGPLLMIGANLYHRIAAIDEQLTVACPMQTRVSLRALDNRRSSADNPFTFGLGFGKGKKAGWFRLNASAAVGDGRGIALLYRWDDDTSWREQAFWGVEWADDSVDVSWAESGQTLPQAFETLEIKVTGDVAVSNTLDTHSEVALDGSTTLELRYL